MVSTGGAHSRPRLRIEGQLGRRAEALYDLMNGVGAHEIIVETARHDRSLHELEIEEISNVIRAYRARIVDLAGDNRVRYVLIFKNHGEGAGAHTISHSISQLVALPITPGTVKAKLMIARDYFALKERCIYCDVLQQEIKGRKRLIADNEDFVAFAPFASRFPFEMAAFLKFHSSAFGRIAATQIEHLAQILRDVLRKLDQTVGGPPYNLSLHDRPVLRQRRGYWNTNRGGLPLAYRNLASDIPYYWIRVGFGILLQPSTTRSSRSLPYCRSHVGALASLSALNL